MSTALTDKLLTAEEYALLPDNGRPTELVRGRVVEMNTPYPRHGYYCSLVNRIIGNFVEEHGLGRVMSNDSGVITERGPDTVRGADVAYYSYQRLPQGPLPEAYLPVVPELIVEVRSPSDRTGPIMRKVVEYLESGVSFVCLLDTRAETLTVYQQDASERVLTTGDELFLLTTRGCWHNPTRDRTRVIGRARVATGVETYARPVSIAGRDFTRGCGIDVDLLALCGQVDAKAVVGNRRAVHGHEDVLIDELGHRLSLLARR